MIGHLALLLVFTEYFELRCKGQVTELGRTTSRCNLKSSEYASHIQLASEKAPVEENEEYSIEIAAFLYAYETDSCPIPKLTS